jgi:hypothetical protein
LLDGMGGTERRGHRGSSVPIAFPAMQRGTVADTDPLGGPVGRSDMTRACGSHRDPPEIRPCLDTGSSDPRAGHFVGAHPSDNSGSLGAVSGKPLALVWHICRLCLSVGWVRSVRALVIRSVSGVLSPAQAASSQWVLGVLRRWRAVRSDFVRLPAPVSSGNPNASRAMEACPAGGVHYCRIPGRGAAPQRPSSPRTGFAPNQPISRGDPSVWD